MERIGFRGRLFLILLCFALVPSVVLTAAWAASWWVLPLTSTAAAWDSAAVTGARTIAIARKHPLSRADSAAITQHEEALVVSNRQSRRAGYVFRKIAGAGALATLLAFALLVLVASRVAGHLSRSLSRPVRELVGWTENITHARPIPDGEPARGAPEFAVLRERMRDMAAGLERGRKAALEAERLTALRETARQVAHELKNPLTPIRFAVERLRREAPPPLHETVEVLAIESKRLEELARSFAQFGRLPEGPRAPVAEGATSGVT